MFNETLCRPSSASADSDMIQQSVGVHTIAPLHGTIVEINAEHVERDSSMVERRIQSKEPMIESPFQLSMADASYCFHLITIFGRTKNTNTVKLTHVFCDCRNSRWWWGIT